MDTKPNGSANEVDGLKSQNHNLVPSGKPISKEPTNGKLMQERIAILVTDISLDKNDHEEMVDCIGELQWNTDVEEWDQISEISDSNEYNIGSEESMEFVREKELNQIQRKQGKLKNGSQMRLYLWDIS